jgi:DNA-binding MarR family transcriptional regulator/GNAT superfamily N-acetyltransferase
VANTTDFFDEVGELGLGSRLKRLSDRVMADAGKIYKHFGVDMEPRWFPLLSLLNHEKEIGVVEASVRLGVSQPAISQFAKEMKDRGLLAVKRDAQDSRKRNLALTEEGHALIKRIQPMWKAVRSAAEELCQEADPRFFESLKKFEKAMDQRSLVARACGLSESSDVEIIPYSPKLKSHFAKINREWLNDMFRVEASDKKIFADPQGIVLDRGGQIWFARTAELGIVGTCALLKTGPHDFELTKMGVLKKARGLKIGEALLQHVIRSAPALGARNLYLLTNSKCQPAIHLYRKNGFVDDAAIMARYGAKYERCDVAMRYAGR